MADRHSGRRIFSPLVFSQIKRFVAQGLNPAEIAARIGCKLGSLRVKCSQRGISLRHWKKSKSRFPKRLIISLPENIALDLQKQADKKRVSKPILRSLFLTQLPATISTAQSSTATPDLRNAKHPRCRADPKHAHGDPLYASAGPRPCGQPPTRDAAAHGNQFSCYLLFPGRSEPRLRPRGWRCRKEKRVAKS
jgi:hypothetical protein